MAKRIPLAHKAVLKIKERPTEAWTADRLVAHIGGLRGSVIHRLGEARRLGLVKPVHSPVAYVPTKKLIAMKPERVLKLVFKK